MPPPAGLGPILRNRGFQVMVVRERLEQFVLDVQFGNALGCCCFAFGGDACEQRAIGSNLNRFLARPLAH